MSDASNRWVGVGVALFAAVGLAATELVDTPNEWGELDQADFEAADVAAGRSSAEYETAAAKDDFVSVDAELRNGLGEAADTATTLESRSVAAAPDAPAEVHPVSRLKVDRDGHFALTASARDFFDSYYQTYSSSSDEVVRGRIVLALLDGLPPRAADEAISALDEWRDARATSPE